MESENEPLEAGDLRYSYEGGVRILCPPWSNHMDTITSCGSRPNDGQASLALSRHRTVMQLTIP
jgi:hypothetical protein